MLEKKKGTQYTHTLAPKTNQVYDGFRSRRPNDRSKQYIPHWKRRCRGISDDGCVDIVPLSMRCWLIGGIFFRLGVLHNCILIHLAVSISSICEMTAITIANGVDRGGFRGARWCLWLMSEGGWGSWGDGGGHYFTVLLRVLVVLVVLLFAVGDCYCRCRCCWGCS